MRVKDKKGVLLSLLMMSVIAVFFWTQSRFPALEEKAQMGQRTSLSGLAFDVLVPLSAEQSHVERIAYSALNWAYTNWKGMTFGLLFAASVLTLLSYLSFQQQASVQLRFRDHIKHAIQGLFLGSPMGVCANCSTPVAFGMYRGGTPLAMSLALLSSSPSFNFIVVSMSLALLPLEMVLVKYALVCIFIVLFIPIILKFNTGLTNASHQFGRVGSELSPEFDGFCELNAESKWWPATQRFGREFFKRVNYVVWATVPLMLLAGALAAVLVEFVSPSVLTAQWQWALLLPLAVVTTLFPIPIAFDVVVCVALLSMGVSPVYVSAAYFCLGVFSLYPAMVIARDFSWRLSLGLLVSVMLLGVAGALLTDVLQAQKGVSKLGSISQGIEESERVKGSMIPLNKSRAIVRQAARLCHRLGEPAQYECFERFVLETLASHFTVQSCQYLEDAHTYRQRCLDSFSYLKYSSLALERSDISVCSALVAGFRNRCEYDYAFKAASLEHNLALCTVLRSSEESLEAKCIDEVLALNLEQYQDEDICATLVAEQARQNCLQQYQRLNDLHTRVRTNDIRACHDLSDFNELRQCQGQIMVTQLEQGAGQAICELIDDAFLKRRCENFKEYFSLIPEGELERCAEINDERLQALCRPEAIQSKLSLQMEQIRYQFLGAALEQNLEGASGNDLAQAIDSIPKVVSLEGSKFELKSEQNHFFSVVEKQLKSPSVFLEDEKNNKAFEARAAQSFGLLDPPPMKLTELFEPFFYGRGIAAGDWNNDDWGDLVAAYDDRVRLYRNVGGKFHLQKELFFSSNLSPMLVALVDLNADEKLDLFVSYYGGQNRIYWNYDGAYQHDKFFQFKLANTQLVMSAAFQDRDLDGDIDMVLGAWSFGDLRHFKPQFSQNYFLENRFQAKQFPVGDARGTESEYFRAHPLLGAPGETLSLLLSDMDDDGSTELYVANDMDGPDLSYQWRQGRFELAIAENSRANIPWLSSFNTMSVDSADINRDLKLDYFSVDMSFSADEGVLYCDLPGIRNRERCSTLVDAELRVSQGDANWCQNVSVGLKEQCFKSQLITLAKQAGRPEFCEMFAQKQQNLLRLCLAASQPLLPKESLLAGDAMKAVQRNVLLLSGDDGFSDQTLAWNAAESYWSWNAKIADLDNDGWQDIYIGNGFAFGGRGRPLHSNVLLQNKRGKRFVREEDSFGLNDYLNTPSFVLLDFDRDGDLDIISQRVAATHGFFVNHSSNKSISFSFGFRESSASVLGSKVIIYYGEEQQMIELKSSGGFLSFTQPEAMFGLGDADNIDRLEVLWADGGKDVLKYAFKAGHHYELSR